MVKRLSGRARLGRVLIAVAVLVPAALILTLIFYSRIFLLSTRGSAWTWVFADAALLGLGFLLNRGEDL